MYITRRTKASPLTRLTQHALGGCCRTVPTDNTTTTNNNDNNNN